MNNDTKMSHINSYAVIYSVHIASSENDACKVNNKLDHSTSIKTHNSGATGRSYQVKIVYFYIFNKMMIKTFLLIKEGGDNIYFFLNWV